MKIENKLLYYVIFNFYNIVMDKKRIWYLIVCITTTVVCFFLFWERVKYEMWIKRLEMLNNEVSSTQMLVNESKAEMKKYEQLTKQWNETYIKYYEQLSGVTTERNEVEKAIRDLSEKLWKWKKQ